MLESSWIATPALAALAALAACTARVEVEEQRGSAQAGAVEREEAGDEARPPRRPAETPSSVDPPLDEAEACEALSEAYLGRALENGCAATMQVCPNYLRARYGVCESYAAASVDRCVARMEAAPSCEALYDLYDCEVKPSGCGP